MLGSLILYLEGMRTAMFQLSGFYCNDNTLFTYYGYCWIYINNRCEAEGTMFRTIPTKKYTAPRGPLPQEREHGRRPMVKILHYPLQGIYQSSHGLGTLTRRVHIHYYYGIRPKRPSPLWFCGPDSIIVVFMDPLGKAMQDLYHQP